MFQFEETNDDWSSTDEQCSETLSDDDNNDDDVDDDDDDDNNNDNEMKQSSTSTPLTNGSLYKPHKCRRCFYRSNWKTDMLHHIRLKHQLPQASKSDYTSMDFHSALQTFSTYEKTFGKVLKS